MAFDNIDLFKLKNTMHLYNCVISLTQVKAPGLTF